MTRRGFTISEVLVSVFAAGIVLAGALFMITSLLRQRDRSIRAVNIHSAAIFGAAHAGRAVNEAHHIALPPPGAEGGALETYKGRLYNGALGRPRWVNPETMDATGEYERFHTCRDGAGQWFFRRDRYLIADDPAPAVPCGAGAGWEALLMSPRQVSGRFAGDALFSRRGGSRQNLVELWLTASDPSRSPAQSVDIRVNLQAQSAAMPPP